MRNTQKGITLIALIITIIVLLILAGISIGALTGDNSIIKSANQAKRLTNENERLEFIKTAVAKALADSKYGGLTEENLKKYIGDMAKVETIRGKIIVSFDDEKEYEVGEEEIIEHIKIDVASLPMMSNTKFKMLCHHIKQMY